MITIRFDMLPGGDATKQYPLGSIVICNDNTGDQTHGNYIYAISHAGTHYGKQKDPWKTGRVIGFNRKKSVYELLALCLKDAGLSN